MSTEDGLAEVLAAELAAKWNIWPADARRMGDELSAAVTAFLLERLDADEVRDKVASKLEITGLLPSNGNDQQDWFYARDVAQSALAAVKSALGGA